MTSPGAALRVLQDVTACSPAPGPTWASNYPGHCDHSPAPTSQRAASHTPLLQGHWSLATQPWPWKGPTQPQAAPKGLITSADSQVSRLLRGEKKGFCSQPRAAGLPPCLPGTVREPQGRAQAGCAPLRLRPPRPQPPPPGPHSRQVRGPGPTGSDASGWNPARSQQRDQARQGPCAPQAGL